MIMFFCAVKHIIKLSPLGGFLEPNGWAHTDESFKLELIDVCKLALWTNY